MHRRRARPTLRLLRDDLREGWDSPRPGRLISAGDHEALLPLAELAHPLIRKAAESFSDIAAEDSPVGMIGCVSDLWLHEIKIEQWRGGVWRDPDTGVNWLVVGGLAKGNHLDRDDFYQRLAREQSSGKPATWLPTEQDERLLKLESAARLLSDWELAIQVDVRDALLAVHDGGSCEFRVRHPRPDLPFLASVLINIEVLREPRYQSDEILVEINPNSDAHPGQTLLWQLTTRILISLCPPVQEWDRTGNLFSNIAPPGEWKLRLEQLDAYVRRGELVLAELGSVSHFAHRSHLADSAIDGTAVRALCGVFFVPMQDHEALPTCSTCSQRYESISESVPSRDT